MALSPGSSVQLCSKTQRQQAIQPDCSCLEPSDQSANSQSQHLLIVLPRLPGAGVQIYSGRCRAAAEAHRTEPCTDVRRASACGAWRGHKALHCRRRVLPGLRQQRSPCGTLSPQGDVDTVFDYIMVLDYFLWLHKTTRMAVCTVVQQPITAAAYSQTM